VAAILGVRGVKGPLTLLSGGSRIKAVTPSFDAIMTGDSVVLYISCTVSATVQSVHVHAHTVCAFFVYRRPTLILSNVWEIFQHFQKLGKPVKGQILPVLSTYNA